MYNKNASINKDNTFRGEVWGRKGDKVKIISINGNAVIYENEKEERYPCNIKDFENVNQRPSPEL